jgi:hypothetical protein
MSSTRKGRLLQEYAGGPEKAISNRTPRKPGAELDRTYLGPRFPLLESQVPTAVLGRRRAAMATAPCRTAA